MLRRVQVLINGDPQELDTGLTISGLLTHLTLHTRRVAVEVNRVIIPREQYATHVLADGDHIEIVHFVGGG